MVLKQTGAKVMTAGAASLARVGEKVLGRVRPDNLTGEVALITGGSRGLGFLLAREFAQAGCRVAICARHEVELERARKGLALDGIEALSAPYDVGDPDQVQQMVDAVYKHYGRIDILVNNAGTIQGGPVEAMSREDFEETLRVMYLGVVYPTLAVLPRMRARGSGRIVNITSIGGKVSVPHLLPYSGAKFAAVGFSEGLRAEVAKDGIQVTTIAPGLMRTGSYLNAFFKGQPLKEYSIFSVIANLPIISMDAERAAHEIVAATRRGEAERVLGLPARILALAHGLFPGLTTDLLGLANRLLPSSPEGVTDRYRGMLLDKQIDSRIHDTLTTLGRSAAVRFNQFPGAEPNVVHTTSNGSIAASGTQLQSSQD